jgi:hypothetical protein
MLTRHPHRRRLATSGHRRTPDIKEAELRGGIDVAQLHDRWSPAAIT